MSQVIQKFEPGGKTAQPRLYKRGNEDINLDTFSNEATIELQRRLANSRLKDKEKSAVQAAFSRILKGMYDGTFTYRIGGGYNNSIGMANTKKGFDAAGIAAGILGDVLRNQSTYVAPEEKSDTSKITWNGNASIGNAITRKLFGSNTINTRDFIGLDYDSTSKKVTGNTQRSARFKSALEYIRDNFDNLFTSFTNTDKASALEDVNIAIRNLSDNNLSDNEYLDLGRATGMSNLRELFGNTQELSVSTTPSGNGTENITYNNEDAWKAVVHPRSTVSKLLNRSLKTTALYKREDRRKLNEILSNLPKENLLTLIKIGINTPNTDLNKGKSIIKGFGYLTNFENNFIIRQALEVLRRREYIKPIASNSNYYYLPYESDVLDQRSTGLVYQISPDGNHALIEMDRNDIPYFTDAWHQEFIGQIPSNKKGGTLKFQTGGWFEKLYKQKALNSWNKNLSNVNWKRGTTFHGNAEDLNSVALANSNYTADQKAVEQDINSFVETFDKNLTPQQIVNLYNENASKIRGFWEGNDVDYLSTDASAHNQLFQKMFTNRSKISGGNPNYNLSYQTGDIEKQAGSQTWHRRMDRYEKEYDQLTDEEKKLRTHTITRIVNGVPQTFQVYKKANGDIALLNDLTDVREQLQQDIHSGLKDPENATIEEDIKDPNNDSILNERFFSDTDKPKGSGNFISKLTPDLIGAGRLFASLRTNNKIYDAILPSLKPVLKDTYERYSPITGAFSAMQLKNRQGADVMRQANQPFTSDSSLTAARMFEGQRQANQLQAEGFLADNQEIRRTKAEALARQEDNMARRSEIANFNRASINQTNRERAQLEATKLRSNWQSLDNFLQGAESRIRTRMDENRERANNFYDRLSTSQAEEWYNNVMEPADRAYAAWQKANPGADPSTDWDGGRSWTAYVKHKREARARANAMIYSDMANRYGLHYTNPYTDESNALFNWNRRYV